MKLEDQVVSLELAKKLKSLGVKQESHFYWEVGKGETNVGPYYFPEPPVSEFYLSAFTVAELGEMLPPDKIRTLKWKGFWYCELFDERHTPISAADERFVCDTEADARAKMLIYLLENKLI